MKPQSSLWYFMSLITKKQDIGFLVKQQQQNIVCRGTTVESWNMPIHLSLVFCVFTFFLWGFVKVGAHVVVASIQAVKWRASVGRWITEGSRLFETAVPAPTHNPGGTLTYKRCNAAPAARVSDVCAGALCPNSFGRNVNERYSKWFIHNTGPQMSKLPCDGCLSLRVRGIQNSTMWRGAN